MRSHEKKTQRVIQLTTSCPSCNEPVEIVLDQALVEALVKTFSMEKYEAAIFIEHVFSNRSGTCYHIRAHI